MKVVRKRPSRLHTELANTYRDVVGSLTLGFHERLEPQDDELESQDDTHEKREDETTRTQKSVPVQRFTPHAITFPGGTLLLIVFIVSLLVFLVLLVNSQSRNIAQHAPALEDTAFLPPIIQTHDAYRYRALEW